MRWRFLINMKKIIFLITAFGGFFIANDSWATCDISSSFTDGAVLTGAQLNTFVTESENCSNAIIDGDTFTGPINLHSGADLNTYSDTGSTLTASIDGATGDALLAPRANGAYGLSLTGPTAGVVTIQCRNAACSATNPAFVVMNSTTAGQQVTLKVTSGGAFTDDSGSSDFVNLGFGITEAAAWAQDVPFFLYVVNRGNTALNGSDGNSMFLLARSPVLSTTPSSANDIGDTGAIPTNDSQSVVVILADVTVANYTSLPVELIGAIRMQWSTVTDDWTVQALGQSDGISNQALNKTFKTVWQMPTGQNGAASGSYLVASGGGTVPTWATGANIDYEYTLSRDGYITFWFSTGAAGNCTNGGAGGTMRLALPAVFTPGTNFDGLAMDVGNGSIAGTARALRLDWFNGQSVMPMYHTIVTTIATDDFSNSADDLRAYARFKAF
jgi:hypothetical protein